MQVSRDSETAKLVQSTLEHTLLKDVTAVTEIYYDPDVKNTIVEEDKDFVETYYQLSTEDLDLARLSPWVLRIELEKWLVVDKKIEMSEFVDLILREYGDEGRDWLHVIVSDDNADKLVIRIRILNEHAPNPDDMADDIGIGQDDDVFLRRLEKNILGKLKLRGIEDVKKVFLRKGKKKIWDDKEGFGAQDEWILETDGTSLLEVRAGGWRGGGGEGVRGAKRLADKNERTWKYDVQRQRARAERGFSSIDVAYRVPETDVDIP